MSLSLLSISCFDNNEERITENLQGTIGIYEGNCMPAPGNPPCKPSPFSTMVLITKPSEHFNQDLAIDSVRSDANGQYSIYLPAGKYSLFLRDGNEIVCDSWFSDGQNTYCLPFEIKKDSVTVMDANIDHAAW
jgi:hypothetical protein